MPNAGWETVLMYDTATIFPEVIDNSLLKDFRACPQRALRARLQGLHATGPVSIDLHFGKCLAKAVETARKAFFELGSTPEQAVADAVAVGLKTWVTVEVVATRYSAKTLPNLVTAIQHYFATWPLDDDTLPRPIEGGIEMQFVQELPFRHPETGKPLMYGGCMDMLAMNDMGGMVIVDEKTAGTFSDSWLWQWDMDPQMTGYIWYAWQQTQEIPHALIRGLSISNKEIGHTLVPVFRTAHQIGLWHEQMLRDVERMLIMYNAGFWDRTLGEACVKYGRQCEFMSLCNTPNTAAFIESSYNVEFWNPVATLLKEESTK